MAKKNFQREVELKIDYGNRVAPHSETLEDTVLGQILINSEAISDVMNFLHKEVFFMPQNQIIFEAMENLAKENLPITLVTVIERLNATEKLNEVGGPSHITNLSMKVTSSANIEHHAKILIQKYIQRELIRVSAEITEKAFDPACELTELTDEAEKKILEVTDQNMQKKPIVPIEKITSTVFEQFVEASKHKTDFTGVPSGFTKLDKLTAGWQPGSMIVLAARPGMGKTAFVLTMLRNMAVDYNIPVGMFSLEMSCEQLATRLFVGEAEIEQIKLQTGNIRESDIGKLQSAQEKLSAAKIFLDDTPGLPIYEFKSKCRRMVEMNHVKCIVVDYLQLMTAPGYGSREQEVSNISRQIKATAMELKIPIIALAQLNRGVEGRIGTKEKKPRLSDLRESGAIEQDADLVMFIHRDAKALGTNEIDGRDISKDADIIVAKNRHGASDDIKLQFIGQYMKFKEPEYDNFVPLEQISSQNDTSIFESKANLLDNDPFAMDTTKPDF